MKVNAYAVLWTRGECDCCYTDVTECELLFEGRMVRFKDEKGLEHLVSAPFEIR